MDQLKTSPSSVDDNLFAAIRSGGSEGKRAVMHLYKLYHRDVRSCMRLFIMRHGCWCGESEDFLHDAFVVMIDKIRNGKPYIITLRAYWLGIAKYLWLNQRRRTKLIHLICEDETVYGVSSDTPESILLHHEGFEEIEKYLMQCHSKCRDLVIMWLAGFSMQEIAEQLHMPGAPAVRKLKFTCFKKLRVMLAEHIPLKP